MSFYDQPYVIENYCTQPSMNKLSSPVFKSSTVMKGKVMLRLKRVQLLKKRDPFGKSEVYFISSITDGIGKDPIKIIEVDPWENVSVGQFLDILPPGIVLYLSPGEELPQFLDWRFLVMESDKGTMNKGQLLTDLSQNGTFQQIQSSLQGLILAASPLSVILGIADTAFQFIGSILKSNQDDFLSKGAVTYTQVFDNFGVPMGSESMIFPHGNGLLKIGDVAIQYEVCLKES